MIEHANAPKTVVNRGLRLHQPSTRHASAFECTTRHLQDCLPATESLCFQLGLTLVRPWVPRITTPFTLAGKWDECGSSLVLDCCQPCSTVFRQPRPISIRELIGYPCGAFAGNVSP